MNNLKGLTQNEVNQKKAEGLANIMPSKTAKTYKEIIRRNVFNFINNVLYLICLVLIFLGSYTDALVTISVVLINVIVGLIQEVRAKQKLDKMARLNRPKIRVLRNYKENLVDPDEIVLGDLVVIKPGDQIVVDGPIISGQKIEFDESQLTGESDLLKKSIGDKALSGSFCVSGSGVFEVTTVGEQSMVNKIATGATAERRVLTPLQKEINTIVKILILVASYLQILVLTSNLLLARQITEIVGNIGVVVGLVPNGLFLMITLAYSLGAIRMAGTGVLVQELNAVESLSNINVLCLDKTGTITTGELEFGKLITNDIEEKKLKRVLGNFVFNQSNSNKTTEIIKKKFKGKKLKIIDESPFSSSTKWSGLVVTYKSKEMQDFNGTFVLGAPEIIDSAQSLKKEAIKEVELATKEGYRVLYFAFSPAVNKFIEKNGRSVLPKNLKVIGVVVLHDKLRDNLEKTLVEFRKYDIEFKIISGDNPATVLALAKQAKVNEDLFSISGIDLAKLGYKQKVEAILSKNIFGRITPTQKAEIIQILQEHGKYVAMIGDGVNDVLSLKKSNLGIAMESGAQATRSIADIVLLKDNFGSLPIAFSEGQRIRNGMESVVNLFLTRVLFTVLLIISIGIAAIGFPFSIRQNSFLALFTVGLPAFSLTLWASPGRHGNRSLITSLINFVFPAGVILSLFSLVVYLGYLYINYVGQSYNLELGRIDSADFIIIFNNISDRVQAILTTFVAFAALTLVMFVAPLGDFWKTGIESSNSKKPSIFAIFLIVFIVTTLFSPHYVSIFDLRILEFWEIVYISIFYLIWLLTMRYIWKRKTFSKFFWIR